jgi:hypothetical protein
VTEKLQPLVDAIREATGQKTHPTTAARWAKEGIRGVRLTVWKLGGRRLTTTSAVMDFITATTANDRGESAG